MEDGITVDEALASRGYRPKHAGMRICPSCYEVYETESVEGITQTCSCTKGFEEPRWEHHDFNEKAMLCRCCGLDLLQSGSRWSCFFCRECQLMAMGVSVWNRRLVFPIGRHSVMHSWVPDAPAPSLGVPLSPKERMVKDMQESLQRVKKGGDGLRQWYRIIMPRNLKTLGLAGAVEIRAYLLAVVREDMQLRSRIEAFDGMCDYFRTMPLDGRRN